MRTLLHNLWREKEGQDIAEYAVMLAVILVIVVGTIRLVGSQANNVFSPERYAQQKSLLGKRVIATGTLFREHTAHHHTPLLLTVRTLEDAGR